MTQFGLLYWLAAWGYLLALNGSVSRTGLCLAVTSLAASFGRVAARVYVAGLLLPFLYPAHASALVASTLAAAAAAQVAAAGLDLIRRARACHRERERRGWKYAADGEPVFGRGGEPMNLAAWKALAPRAFEEETVELFRRCGYDGDLTPASGDEGIDLQLWKDGHYFVGQCKQVRKSVGQPVVRDFAGAVHASGAEAGFVITTSRFTAAAERWCHALPELCLVLIDGEALVEWAETGHVPVSLDMRLGISDG